MHDDPDDPGKPEDPDAEHVPCEFLGVMAVVGGKWRATTLYCLTQGPMRFTQLQAGLAPVSAKVLTQELRALERDGVVERVPDPQAPRRGVYALTALGVSLADWRRNLPAVERSRQAHDGRPATRRGQG